MSSSAPSSSSTSPSLSFARHQRKIPSVPRPSFAVVRNRTPAARSYDDIHEQDLKDDESFAESPSEADESTTPHDDGDHVPDNIVVISDFVVHRPHKDSRDGDFEKVSHVRPVIPLEDDMPDEELFTIDEWEKISDSDDEEHRPSYASVVSRG